jgi:hypothetical protein
MDTELGFDPSTFVGVNNPLPALMAGPNTINLFFKSNSTLEHPDMELLAGISPAGPSSALMLLRLYQNRGSSGKTGGTLKLRSNDPSEGEPSYLFDNILPLQTDFAQPLFYIQRRNGYVS